MPDPVLVPDPPPPAVSPTGAPVLPPKAVPYAVYAVAIAAALMLAPDAGIVLPAALLTAAKVIVLIAAPLGIASPGQRK